MDRISELEEEYDEEAPESGPGCEDSEKNRVKVTSSTFYTYRHEGDRNRNSNNHKVLRTGT